MLSIPEKKFSIGCIVARFQVDMLHVAQMQLIDFVAGRHEKVIVVLGVSPLPNSRKNPLPFEARRQMLAEVYPNVHVIQVKNNISDEIWSKNLDTAIRDVLTMQQSVLLYGSRDSFIKHYSGKFQTLRPDLIRDIILNLNHMDIRIYFCKHLTSSFKWKRILSGVWKRRNS
jgi:hypothetical protein